MSRRNLLICFDAFDTLFTPKRPIAQQYGEVARSLGLGGFSDEQVQASFKAAFKKESKEHPNYGKAKGMQPETWWTTIIHNTFQPLIGEDQPIHHELAPRLLHRFSSDEGYMLYPDVMPLIRRLRSDHLRRADGSRVVVGIISNSDPRVPSVLRSLGLSVGPIRYGHTEQLSAGDSHDIDFTVMSYDVGHEKPDKRIFAAADELLKVSPKAAGTELSLWDKVYIGDDFQNDVEGALNAGWKVVLVDRKTSNGDERVLWQDRVQSTTLLNAFDEAQGRALGFSNLAELARLLPGGEP